ncbi:MAG: OmpH family outer membrane protein [Bacteroidetes bacterium]|nr:OmpH family outer membrane protein [Bacteroidota bacterium]MCH8524163.1 OmpH family outer membrane protein [Balneolales bacterium]
MKKTLLLGVFTAICFLAFYTPQAQAQSSELRIGYVDPNTVLMRMPEMAAVERRLQNFAERKRREFAQLQNQIQEMDRNLEDRRAVISAEAVAREEQRITEMFMELQQFEQNYAVELQQQQAELMGPLLQRVQQAIDAVASELRLTFVLNTMTNNGDFIILYASPEMQQNYDITTRVAERLDL